MASSQPWHAKLLQVNEVRHKQLNTTSSLDGHVDRSEDKFSELQTKKTNWNLFQISSLGKTNKETFKTE